jgi:hypothetical protein
MELIGSGTRGSNLTFSALAYPRWFDLKWPLQRNRAADGRPKANQKANGVLMEMPATPEVAAAKAAHVTAAKAAHLAEVSAGEMSPVAVENEAPVEAVVKAVIKAAASDEDRPPNP